MLNPNFLKRLRSLADNAEDKVPMDPSELLMLLDELDENAEEIQQLAEDLLALDNENDEYLH